MITLKPEIVKEIRESKQLKLAVQTALQISHTTLYKYLDNNDPALANVNVLEALKTNTTYKTDQQLLSK